MNVPVPKVPGDLRSVSPSQLKEYKLCPRKHWLNKRAGLPQPEGDHLIIGTAAHGAQESYFETSKLYVPEEFAKSYFPAKPELEAILTITLHSGLQLLADPDAPRPKPGILLETPRNYNTGLKIAGIALRQRSDLLDPTDKALAHSWDWKTSGNVFSDYTKTGEELAYDEQGVLYAKEAFERFHPDAVEFHHGIMGTKRVESDIVSTRPMTKEHVDEQFAVLAETVAEMREHFKIDNFFETRPGKNAPSANYGSPCRAFKGCPYAEICGVELPLPKSEQPVLKESPTMVVTLSLKERLARAKLAQGINPPDAAKPLPVIPYVPPTVSATPVPTAATTSSTQPRAVELLQRIETDLAELRSLVGAVP